MEFQKTMAILDRVKDSTANVRSYFSHFSRGILLLIGVLVIGGLVAATFLYGDEKRNQAEQNTTSEETAVAENAPEPATEAEQNTTQTPSSPVTPSTNPQTSNTSASTTPVTNTPRTIANTGPEAVYALGIFALAAAFVTYKATKTRLYIAQVSAR